MDVFKIFVYYYCFGFFSSFLSSHFVSLYVKVFSSTPFFFPFFFFSFLLILSLVCFSLFCFSVVLFVLFYI